MKKSLLLILCGILACAVICSCGEKPSETDTQTGAESSQTESDTQESLDKTAPENPDPAHNVSSFYDLNKQNNTELSHKGDTAYANLELDYRSLVKLDLRDLKTSTVYYPRLKLMADGNYIMFYQYGEHGDTIYYITSSDLAEWSEPKELFTYEENNDIKYATCDAVVLDNGEILAVCSYRQGSTYDVNPHLNGIVMKKSADNGKSWSEQKKIYVGTTWEPYPMQLSTGEVQVYFTNTTCYYKTAVADASTGTAMVRSTDRGATWTGDLSVPYSAQIVSQTATRVSAGQQLYSDQMPVGIELLGSNKIMLALETRLDKDGNYRISLSYSDDNWKTPLAVDQIGPAEKQSKAWTGAAPYLRQFISGEIVCGYTRSNDLAYRMIDSEGKKFSTDEYKPFEGISSSYWGALEMIGTHTLVGVGETFNKITVTRTENTIDYGKLNLNHTIKAQSDDAVFVGSISQAQASVRVAEKGQKLIFTVDRLDYFLDEKNDTVMIYFADKNDEGYYRVTVGCTGVTAFDRFDGKKFTSLDKTAVVFTKKLNGTAGYDDDTDIGYTVEVTVNADMIDAIGDLHLAVNLLNTDKGKKSEMDSMTGVDITKKDTWVKVISE